jgi:hypothetical protein
MCTTAEINLLRRIGLQMVAKFSLRELNIAAFLGLNSNPKHLVKLEKIFDHLIQVLLGFRRILLLL